MRTRARRRNLVLDSSSFDSSNTPGWIVFLTTFIIRLREEPSRSCQVEPSHSAGVLSMGFTINRCWCEKIKFEFLIYSRDLEIISHPSLKGERSTDKTNPSKKRCLRDTKYSSCYPRPTERCTPTYINPESSRPASRLPNPDHPAGWLKKPSRAPSPSGSSAWR
ncbi:hypothetical protein I7I53_12015 [Histoplasma capsulatum var. duboisii H88]|uniref:Uncharacterized protein n=1 Tax=Ajellomyces capsulatus (strain H88) TaxID=544711 RepID=A0A8A1LUF2_AJEC8|nr:hypothetical protein I7I53_12015 [Histoplasma capsulatum var. duboisii H88]